MSLRPKNEDERREDCEDSDAKHYVREGRRESMLRRRPWLLRTLGRSFEPVTPSPLAGRHPFPPMKCAEKGIYVLVTDG